MNWKFKLMSLLISVLYIPWYLYLQYLILQKIGSTDLMWFLYWVGIPLTVFFVILSELAKQED
jgi:hypothetical protein